MIERELKHQKKFFADIIVPLSLPKTFTYQIPKELIEYAKIGSRSIIPFGRSKILTGIIYKIHKNPPQSYETKEIIDLLDDIPTFNTMQLEFFSWLSDYYMCNLGDIIKAAMPAGLKVSSESVIELNPDIKDIAPLNVNENELTLINKLKLKGSIPYKKLEELFPKNQLNKIIKSLLDQNLILIYEDIKNKYKPKKLKVIGLNQKYIKNRNLLDELFVQLENKPKQLEVLLAYLKHIPILNKEKVNFVSLPKKKLLKENISSSSLETLIKHQVFYEKDTIISRLDNIKNTPNSEIILSDTQKKAIQSIYSQFENKNVVLLHGITGSGKTEIYIKLIQEALHSGGQILYLLPEIALTTQMVKRLRKVFGNKMEVYHSKYSDNERVEVWQKILNKQCSLIIGTRSSIFLPFSHLSLIIVDEEHETSYKQYDPAPRYHARDASIFLAHKHNSKILLGSATPSLESYYNAQNNKYGYVEMNQRFSNVELPEIKIVNINKNNILKNEISKPLLEEIKNTLEEEKQIIIFKNRRGYAPYIQCQECNWSPQCSQCSVNLTYHQFKNKLCCHYCGVKKNIFNECIVCGSHNILNIGFGTEKIEETLKSLIKNARVERMDLDTTRKKHAYEKLIDNFESGKTDILVGTQMITKGFDFSQVKLVGIPDIDRMLKIPDFRSVERCFQMATQVTGRAGRRYQRGKVIIQTSDPSQTILKKIVEGNYREMFNEEILERKNFIYPPYTRLIKIILKHYDLNTLHRASDTLAHNLRNNFGKIVLGPHTPHVSKIKNLFIINIWIKTPTNSNFLQKTKNSILKISKNILFNKDFNKIRLIFDVDPQ